MVILDTNVISEAMKPQPDPRVASWMVRQNAEDLFTTAIAQAEILHGVAILPDGKRKQDLASAARQIFGLFAGQNIPLRRRLSVPHPGQARREPGCKKGGVSGCYDPG